MAGTAENLIFSGSLTGNQYVPEAWSAVGIEVLRNNITMQKLVTMDSDVGTFRSGDILNIPYPGTFTANSKSVGAANDVQIDRPDDGANVTVTLDKHYYVSFLVEDSLAATTSYDLISEYMMAAVSPLADQIDTNLFALYSGLGSTDGTSGVDLTYDTILDAKKTLTDAKCPSKGRNLVISTKDEKALLSDADIVRYLQVARDEQVAEGSIGRLAGFDVFASQLVATSGGTTYNLAFHKGAFILAMRALPAPPAGTGAIGSSITDTESGLSLRVVMSYDPKELGIQVTVDVLYGVKELQDAKGVQVLS